MGYSKDTIAYVSGLFEEKRKRASAELLEKKAELYSAVPRLKEIEGLMADCGLSAVRCVISKTENVSEAIAKLRDESLKLQQERSAILKSLNLPEDYLELNYNCKICQDEGYVEGKMCDCYKKELKKHAYNNLNKASHLQLSDFSLFNLNYYPDTIPAGSTVSVRNKMEQIYNYCLTYAKNFNEKSGSILMSGATGLGKTFLSLSIASAVIEKGYGVIYSSAQNLFNTLEKEKFSNSDANTLNDIFDCDLLIIDDLGTEFSTSFTTSTVYNIINTRINMCKPVIISTNLSLSKLQEMYSERIVSRFIGEYTILKFAGNDIRQIKKMEAVN